jgi:hypothetical protein
MKSRRFMDFALGPKPKNVTTSWKPVVQRNSKVPTSAARIIDCRDQPLSRNPASSSIEADDEPAERGCSEIARRANKGLDFRCKRSVSLGPRARPSGKAASFLMRRGGLRRISPSCRSY